MGKIELKYEHQGISVKNMAESVEWYCKVFDGTVGREVPCMEELNCHIVFVHSGTAQFELFEYLGEDKHPTPKDRGNSRLDLRTGGNKHCCYSLPSMREFYDEKIIPYGIHLDHGPERIGDDWMVFIRDPNDIVYEIFEIGGAKKDPHAFDGIDCIYE